MVVGVLVQIQRALRPDGLFLGAMFGGDTLFELRLVVIDVAHLTCLIHLVLERLFSSQRSTEKAGFLLTYRP
jgi:hypothetical protein